MTNGWDDQELLAALQQALRGRRAVPDEFVEAGKSAFAWRNIDAELAQLTYDSIRVADELVATRAESAAIRALTFTSARLTIELEVTEDSLLGQVLPVQAAAIEIEARGGAEDGFTTDEIGCFSIRPIPRGPFRLHCRAAAGVEVLTSWITL
jgi:hypothetical protein